MSLGSKSGCPLPKKENKSINPYVSNSDNFLVSDCCKAEAVYRVRKDTIDLVPWCPECLETYPLEWKEVNQNQYDEIINDQENKHLYDEMAEHYGKHGLPVKCNEEPNQDRQTEEEKKTLLGLPTSDYDEIIEEVKYPNYEDVLKVIEWTEDDKSNGYYDGHYDDLLPWTFSLSDFQHPDREIELLIDLWNGNLNEDNVVRGCLGNGGYIYYVEAHALLYEIVISPNMGIDSVSIIGTEEEVE